MTPCEAGGRIESQCPKCKISLKFESMVLEILIAEAKCDRARLQVIEGLSVAGDFMSNESIKEKIEKLDESYKECRAGLVALLLAHREIRGIHENRKEIERRVQIIKEAEAKFLWLNESPKSQS